MWGGSEKDNLVDQVKTIQRSGPEAKSAWYNYVATTTTPSKKDPAAHSEEELRIFIDGYQNGTITAADSPFEGGNANLIEKVKAIQREGGKEAWYSFIQQTSNPMKKDPAAHNEEDLQSFIDSYNSGSLGMASMMNNMFEDSGGKKSELVQQVKNFQKESQAQKESWYEFIKTTSDPTSKDPNRHSERDLQRFVSVHINGEPDTSGGNSGGMSGWGGGGGNDMDDMMAMMPMMMQMMKMFGKGKGKGKSRPY